MAQSGSDEKHRRRWPFILAGVLLIADTLLVSMFSNMNLGVLLPAILGTPFVIYGFFRNSGFFDNGAGLLLKRIAVVCYAVYGSLLLAFVVYTGVSAASPPRSAEAIVVLGAGVHGDVPSATLYSRAAAAAAYALESPDTVIIASGGQGDGENISEAQAIKNVVTALGVEESRVVLEDRSTSTKENFVFSKAILDELFGPEPKVVFVTNEFHALRSGMVAKKQGYTDVHPLTVASRWYAAPNFYMREIFTLAVYFVRGDI